MSRGPGAAGADGGRQRDEAFVTLMRSGDDTAFGLLFDAWADPVYDRISNRGFTTADASQIEGNAFSTVHRRLGQNGPEEPFRVMVMRASRQEMTSAEAQRVDLSLPVGPYAEDRLTRGSEVKSLAADPAVAAFLWEAVDVLGDQVREVLDLHYRHGFTATEAATVLQQPVPAIEDILRKVPAGYSAVVRAKIIWRQGQPNHDELAAAVAGQPRFDAAMVRRVAEHLRTCESCRDASQVPVPPIEVFAAIPIAIAPAGFKDGVVASLEGEGVSMKGSVSTPRPGPSAVVLGAVATDAPGALPGRPTAAPDPSADDEPGAPPSNDSGDRTGSILSAVPLAGAAAAGALGAEALSARATPEATAPTPEPTAEPTMLGGYGGSSGTSRPREHLASENRVVSPLDTPFVPRTDGDSDVAEKSAAAAGLAAFVGADAATATTGLSDGAGMGLGDPVDLRTDGSPPDGSGGSNTKRWALIGLATVGVLALLVFFLTSGGGSKKKVATGPAPQSTTTASDPALPSTTAAVTVTTVAGADPTTSITLQTTTTAKGAKPPPVTAQQNVTTTTNALFPNLKRTFLITGANPINTPLGFWDMSAAGAPNLRWSATSDTPITVLVSGPGFSSTQAAGSSASLCPGTVNGNTCVVAPGNYPYTLTVTDSHGHSLPETIVLTVERH